MFSVMIKHSLDFDQFHYNFEYNMTYDIVTGYITSDQSTWHVVRLARELIKLS